MTHFQLLTEWQVHIFFPIQCRELIIERIIDENQFRMVKYFNNELFLLIPIDRKNNFD